MKKISYILLNCLILFVGSILYWLNNKYIKGSFVGCINNFFICYFNDIICPLVLLPLTNLFLLLYIALCKKVFLISVLFLDKIEYGIYHLTHIVGYCLLCGIYWEFIYPINHVDSTSDINDLVCYLIGGVNYFIFFKLINKKRKKNII